MLAYRLACISHGGAIPPLRFANVRALSGRRFSTTTTAEAAPAPTAASSAKQAT